MFSATSEQARRFDAEVANLLLATVQHALLVGRFEFVPGGLESFLLGGAQCLLGSLLRLKVQQHRSEVAVIKVLDFTRVGLGKGGSGEVT